MKFSEIPPTETIVHVVPTPWDNAIDSLNDDDLVDIENWDDKTSANQSKTVSSNRNAAIASFEIRNSKQHFCA